MAQTKTTTITTTSVVTITDSSVLTINNQPTVNGDLSSLSNPECLPKDQSPNDSKVERQQEIQNNNIDNNNTNISITNCDQPKVRNIFDDMAHELEKDNSTVLEKDESNTSIQDHTNNLEMSKNTVQDKSSEDAIKPAVAKDVVVDKEEVRPIIDGLPNAVQCKMAGDSTLAGKKVILISKDGSRMTFTVAKAESVQQALQKGMPTLSKDIKSLPSNEETLIANQEMLPDQDESKRKPGAASRGTLLELCVLSI